MSLISIVIPYYQRNAGILSRAVESILAQQLPQGWSVQVIVVDDGSPHPADSELQNLSAKPPFDIRIVKQENAGVGAARNAGLDAVSSDTDLVAFLDSDDIWPDTHLAHAITAYDRGSDMSFSDNCRRDYHDSHLTQSCPLLSGALPNYVNNDGYIIVPYDEMAAMVISEFPAQASTIVFRHDVAPTLRFDTNLKTCGEDVLYFTQRALASKHICLNTHSKVECGKGVNIFFSELGWDSDAFMAICADDVMCYTQIARIPDTPKRVEMSNKERLTKKRRDFAYHAVRRFYKSFGRMPAEVMQLAKKDAQFSAWFIPYMVYMIAAYPLRLYKAS